MNPTIDLDALVIDGTKLRQAREERGLSVAEVAALCTLSREQVQHIEDGGVRPFYTPAHKLLAIRKYAAAMGIPYDDIVAGPGADDTMPVPVDAPASLMVHGDGEEATDLRLAAVERNAEIRRKILIGAVTMTIVLALYAKMRGTPETLPTALQPSMSSAASEDGEQRTEAMIERTRPATAASPATSTDAAAANGNVATPAAASPAVAALPPKASNASGVTDKTAAQDKAAAPSAAGAPPENIATAASAEACTGPGPGDLKTWTPTYQRKPDTRLFLISPKETTVCVLDASGKAALLKLKARTGQAYSGKPPYVVQSPLLSEMEIYLQGMRARVPPQAPALRLQVSPVTSAPEADAG